MASALELATRVRNLVSERSPAAVNVTVPHIQGLIPTAAETWSRVIASDPDRADSLVNQYTVAVTAGTIDLSNYLDGTTAKLLPQDLRGRTQYVTVSGEKTPCTWVGSYSQLKYGRFIDDVPAIYLDGSTLRFRNTDGSLTSLTAVNATLEGISLPSTATEIPAELVGDFVTYLADLVVREKIVDGR